MGAPARRPGARPLRARRGLGAGWLRRHARFMQDEHGSEATGRVGRNRPTERDCLTSSTRYSAFSVQVQSMGVCGCVECAGPGAVDVWCLVCGCVCSLHIGCVFKSGQTSRGDKHGRFQKKSCFGGVNSSVVKVQLVQSWRTIKKTGTLGEVHFLSSQAHSRCLS